MKKVMGIYFIVAVMCFLPMTVMGATLTAHWAMEETTGSTAYDETANNYDLTPQSGFTISSATTTGQIDNGFVFDGSGERLEHGTLLDTMPTSLTVAGWIKPDATSMSATQCWFSKQNAGTTPGPAEQLWLACAMSGSTPSYIRATGRSNGTFFTLNSTTTWVDDTWYHVAFTWDSSGGEIFVDGQSEASNGTAIMGNGTALNMCIASGGSTSQPFKGVVDEVRVYDGVLTDSEVNDLYDYSTTYTLTVNSGTGDGDYEEDSVNNITADAPASGYVFDAWTGDTAYVANVNSSSTTVTMPAADVTVTATYEPLYTLTVNSGTGDGDYIESSVNNITADAPATGYVFDAWTGDTAYVANVNSSSTTVTMPAAAVTVTATYKLDAAELLAHWEMEETTGSTAYDETANNYDLTPQSGFTISDATTTGKISNGFAFDGTGERLEHSTLLDTLPDSISIAGWIKPDATGMSAGQCWLSKQNVSSGTMEQMWLKCNMSGSTPGVIGVSGRSAGSFFNLNSTVTWVDDTWYHVVFTWDADGGEIYVDNSSEATNALAIMGDGTSLNMCIASGGATSQPFKGVIDDVRIYDGVLTSTEVNTIYNLAPSTFALTVTSGSGDGSYAPSTVVNITADNAASGYLFDAWTGDTAYVADTSDPTTTVTMPSAAVSVTATYIANAAPVVNVGDDFYLDPPLNPTKTLKATATDDGVPGTGLTYTWSKVSGPGTVTFSDDDALQTDITITTSGTYVLRLSVSDSNQIGTDDVTAVVHNNGRLTYEMEILDLPLPTADANDFTEVYTVDVSSYGIYTNGTNAVDTSDGINEMLQDIKTMNPEPNLVIFPTGTYLIDVNDPIVFDHNNIIFDMNDSTFKINPNGLSTATDVVIVDRGTFNFRLTNGTLQGDRYDHTYPADPNDHYQGRVLKIVSGQNLEFDNLTIKDAVGFAFVTRNGIANATETGQYTYVNNSNLESGGFNSSGSKISDANLIRTNTAYDLTKYDEDEFEFGQTYGYMGLFLITEREYQAYFYEPNMAFIEKQDCIQYRKVSLPSNAKYVHLEFNQSNIPTGSYAGRLTDLEPPEYVHIHDNYFYQNRGLGLAVTGGQKMIIEDNTFEKNGYNEDNQGNSLPAMGCDFEDGWDLMQDIIFRNNTFTENRADLVVCAGSEMIFEDNNIDNSFTFYARVENTAIRGNISYDDDNDNGKGAVQYGSKTGHISIHDNSYINGHIYLDNDVAGADPIMLEYEDLDNIRMISLVSPGTAFVFKNCTLENTRWLISSLVDECTFEDCTFVGTDRGLHFYVDGADVTVTETDCTGTLTRYGDYTDREL